MLAFDDTLLTLATLGAVGSWFSRLNPHVWIWYHVGLETRICHSSTLSSIGTLPEVLGIGLCHCNFLQLFIAHNAAPKYTIIWLFSTVHDLCLVSLMNTLGCVLSSTHVHIRLCYSSRSHLVEHDLSFGISSPLLVECGSVDATVHLRGAACKVRVLNLGSSHVCGILPSVSILSSLHNRPQSSL